MKNIYFISICKLKKLFLYILDPNVSPYFQIVLVLFFYYYYYLLIFLYLNYYYVFLSYFIIIIIFYLYESLSGKKFIV